MKRKWISETNRTPPTPDHHQCFPTVDNGLLFVYSANQLYLHPATSERVRERLGSQVWRLSAVDLSKWIRSGTVTESPFVNCGALAVVRLWMLNIDSVSFPCWHFKGSINWIIPLSECPELDCVPSIFAFEYDFQFCLTIFLVPIKLERNAMPSVPFHYDNHNSRRKNGKPPVLKQNAI